MAAQAQSPPPPPTPHALPRWVLALLITLVAAIVAIAAALLDYANGSSIPAALLKGGMAFAGSTGLFLAVVVFISGGRSP